MSAQKIALAQMNPLLGDLAGNAQLIHKAASDAFNQGAKLVVTPELSLTGYPPEDLLLRPAFIQAAQVQLDLLMKELAKYADLTVIVGHPKKTSAGLQNYASVLRNGKVIAGYAKQELPNHEVFDEVRYFVPGNQACVFECEGIQYGLILCEDAWHPGPAKQAHAAGAQILLVPNASPYHLKKEALRIDVLRGHIDQTQMPLIYVNAVGGQDELVFDGGSFALNKNSEVVMSMPQFETGLGIVNVTAAGELEKDLISPPQSVEAQAYQALVLGVRDYVTKNRFPGVIIGLSGGVDSALVLAIAVDALGADKVRAVMMASRYTADISWIDARELAKNLDVQYDEIPISGPVDALEQSLAEQFKGMKVDATEENIQARVRGTMLMALSNKTGRLVLTTGNKSEMAVGYCTLYGDMAGGFAVIKDIAKTLVYRLCTYRNSIAPVIPERILTRAPSAELRPDQTDQDSLPSYEVLDGIVERYMEQNQSIEQIIAEGYDPESVEKVTRLIKLNEYKRRQAPPGVRVTTRAFGRDWRYPITSQFRA
ncbi:NAD+ synthase [Polynucleobacter wuianus]|uniref:Glutamine-dependent NAD(+) synthetase n=1 Tax=Polynucleobacter wuianus TaxID=1743168 RepID=A0A191UFW1_9BURK|nr:NAD+ synthase [Polynucleobacter wuianus]ANI99842.1 NAD+ synthase [Polynucleobacter wuianus]MBU3552663.1 NAD+ synthase [Polynucleobacter sp. MWH-Post4-6-1]MBU3610565.1 NAD+ synthase [Polynucleobacter wuianus]